MIRNNPARWRSAAADAAIFNLAHGVPVVHTVKPNPAHKPLRPALAPPALILRHEDIADLDDVFGIHLKEFFDNAVHFGARQWIDFQF